MVATSEETATFIVAARTRREARATARRMVEQESDETDWQLFESDDPQVKYSEISEVKQLGNDRAAGATGPPVRTRQTTRAAALPR